MGGCAMPRRISSALKARMKTLALSASSTLARSFETGDTQVVLRLRCALRMRVSMSPNGSDMDMRAAPLPARLHHAGDLPLAGELPQRDAGELKLAVVRSRTARQLAAQPHANPRAVARELRELERRIEPVFHRQ